MSAEHLFLVGCVCGAVGFIDILVLFFAQDWLISRGARSWRDDMEGE
jgi:hypothetical protein